MLAELMAFYVSGLAYPCTAVVPCVECNLSNMRGLYPWLRENAPSNCNGHWTPKSLCRSLDNQSGVASSPRRNLSTGSVKGGRTRVISVPPDPCKHHKKFNAWCSCTSSLHTLAVWQSLLLCAAVLLNLLTATLWAEMHTSCCWIIIISDILQPNSG